MDIFEAKSVHCIGIGGIGLSAIARYLKSEGKRVTGSDISHSQIIDELRKEGIEIWIGSDGTKIPPDTDLVIYTIAISDDDSEIIEAKKRNITRISYPQALGELTKKFTTIAVTGTHGKTTTTAMLYYALKNAGIDATMIVGSLLKKNNSNFIKGDSEYLLVEACEYRRSFLNLHPKIAIITNIDSDHLDYYKDLNDIKSAFQEFADKIPVDGFIVAHNDIPITHPSLINADEDSSDISLSVMGKHNKANARLVLALAKKLSLDESKVREGLLEFTGTWRRMELKGETEYGVKIYDDYGHHPTEIKASLTALHEAYPDKKIILIFQPHLYSRTKLLFNDFVECLSYADTVYILPIYAAREKVDESISGEMITDALIKRGVNAKNLANSGEIKNIILSLPDASNIVMNIGAGDAYKALDFLQK